VEQPARVVAGHFEQRRVRGLREDDLHLLGGRVQRVLHHLERRRIDPARHAAPPFACPLAADKGPSASLAPSAAGSTYDKYASPAVFGRRLAAGPFSSRSARFSAGRLER